MPDGAEVVVGRIDTGAFVILPADGAALLQRMAEGMAPPQAADWYAAEFGEPVDVDGFVAALRELGFVRERGAEALVTGRPARFQRLGRAIFSPPARAAYLTVMALWAVLMIRSADLRPAPSHIFFTHSLLLVQVLITFGQIPLLFLHEGFHILAGRRLGLPSKLGMSNRWTYIVFETQMNGLLSVPRRKRYLPFLAGMLCDMLVLAALDGTAELTRTSSGSFSVAGRACLALAFTVMVRLLWQFELFLRTDLYYVFATALNCYDLHDASKALLWNRIWRILRRPHRIVDEQLWTDHDRRVGTWYGPFLVLGVGTLLGITAFVSMPVVVQYFRIAIHNVTSHGIGEALFWDGFVSLSINGGQVALLVWLATRKRRRQRGRAQRLIEEVR
ncbi:MAG: hypothetical protein ACJ74O_11090 [Frankiaceae bacterium]